MTEYIFYYLCVYQNIFTVSKIKSVHIPVLTCNMPNDNCPYKFDVLGWW